MAASLHARSLTVSLGPRLILDDVELQLDPGHRVGLVGPNGVGKSTLLRAVAGLVHLDAGTVSRSPANATVGYLPQEPERGDETVRDSVARRTGAAEATEDLEAATNALATGEEGADDRYSAALDLWLALGAADLDSRIGDAWAELGLDERLLDQPMSSLSGGEAARVGLAVLLLARFDVLLLDEPTNDLDLDGLRRLERFVLGSSVAIGLVSHDRTFLESVVTDVVEIDEFSHHAAHYGGGWESYLAEKDLARLHAREAYEEYDAKRSTLQARSQRQREWASQGLSRAKKKPDDNDKFVRNWKINQTEQLAGKAARTDRMLERLEVVEEPREAWELRLTVAAAERSGDVVARLTDAVVRRGSFTLGPVSMEVGFGERIVVVGANGSGKSTLLRALLGEIPVDEGAQWRGPSVVVGRLEQAREQLGDRGSMLDSFLAATGMTVSEARTLLAKFGIGAAHVQRPTSSLSPGERTRAVLALLMARQSNCLVLDEPTNHLDLPAIEQLEQALDTFAGTVLLVTHDRTLLQHVRRTRTLELSGGRIVSDEPA